MSDYRRIWVEAIKANQRMVIERFDGTAEFERLLAKHPNDGMLFLERGEAFEYLKLLDEAEADYTQAEGCLTSPHWKEVARVALRRVRKTRTQSPSTRHVFSGTQQWDAFHRMHGLARVPHDIRKRAVPAIARIAAEPDSAAVDLRWCVEVVVGELEHRFGQGRSSKDLWQRIEDLRHLSTVPNTVVSQMDEVRRFGKQGAHPQGSVPPSDWVTGLAAFIGVFEWADKSLWHDRQSSPAT